MPAQTSPSPSVLAAVLAAVEAYQQAEAFEAARRATPPPPQAPPGLNPWRLFGRSELMQTRMGWHTRPRAKR